MKDQLKTIIDIFFDEWECPSNKVYSERLAEWIDKAIGIDERAVNSALKKVQFHMFVPVNGVRENNNKVTLHNNARKRLTKSITHSRPLKCEAEDVAQGRQDRIDRVV